MINGYLQGAQGAPAVLTNWVGMAVRAKYPSAQDWEESLPGWRTVAEAIGQLRMMAMQSGLYLANFVGPDSLPFSPGMRARLVQGAPPHLRGAVVAFLGLAQGHDVGEVVLLLGQLHNMPGESLPRTRTRNVHEERHPETDRRRSARQGHRWKTQTQSGPAVRWKLWSDLIEQGTPQGQIDGLSTPELGMLWEKKCSKWKKSSQARQTTSEETEVHQEGEVSPASSEEDLATVGWGIPKPQE